MIVRHARADYLDRLPSDNSTAKPKPIKAKLIGERTCSALGITSCANTPVLELCRALIKAGHDPNKPFEAYRGRVLALTVASIAQGAGLEINGHGTGFRPFREGGAASPVRKPAEVDPKSAGRLIAVGIPIFGISTSCRRPQMRPSTGRPAPYSMVGSEAKPAIGPASKSLSVLPRPTRARSTKTKNECGACHDPQRPAARPPSPQAQSVEHPGRPGDRCHAGRASIATRIPLRSPALAVDERVRNTPRSRPHSNPALKRCWRR